VIEVQPGEERAQVVAIQTDGKIVLGGTLDSQLVRRNMTVWRYLSNGQADVSFGTNGKVTTFIGNTSFIGNRPEVLKDLVIQADGKIVTTGYYAVEGNSRRIFLIRYLTDGSLDSGFGSGGIVRSVLVPGTKEQALAMALQSDQKIVITGSVGSYSLIARYNTDGSLDSSFNNTGFVSFGFNSGSRAVAIDQTGSILSAGSVGGNIMMARFNSTGAQDSTLVLPQIIFSTNDMAIQTDGKIIVIGNVRVNSKDKASAMRFFRNGTIDPSFFSPTGIIFSILDPDERAYPYKVLLQPDGKVIIIGTVSSDTVTGNIQTGFLIRLESDGQFDSSFGVGGLVIFRPGFYADLRGAALQSNGKIVVCGDSAGQPSGKLLFFFIRLVWIDFLSQGPIGYLVI
jgi:uncharacterized delta-60 repeat protein